MTGQNHTWAQMKVVHDAVVARGKYIRLQPRSLFDNTVLTLKPL